MGFSFERLIVFISCIVLTSFGYAQGAWDMKYTPIDSLNSTLIGKEIRIDFKASQDDIITGNVNSFKIRKLLSKNDDFILEIGEKKSILLKIGNFM